MLVCIAQHRSGTFSQPKHLAYVCRNRSGRRSLALEFTDEYAPLRTYRLQILAIPSLLVLDVIEDLEKILAKGMRVQMGPEVGNPKLAGRRRFNEKQATERHDHDLGELECLRGRSLTTDDTLRSALGYAMRKFGQGNADLRGSPFQNLRSQLDGIHSGR